MKLSKNTEQEVLNVYDPWMYSYLNGDVATYDSYLDESYHFIGSTGNEEFLNRKDTTNFFEATAEQFSGKTDLRNETRILEQFGELVFVTHMFDAWFLIEGEWSYYGRFRCSSTLQEKKDGWRFIYQHFSTTDSKAEEGETIGYTQVNDENLQLREAVKRRTIELEVKNRELEVEAALARIRTQVTDMNQSADLLDIVVTMRKEFTDLGHEAHYFWHMRWLPDIYEKAMTSGDGTRIGMVMELPRNFHGIEAMTTWESNTEPTAVFALDVDVAVHYIDKMIQVGNFQVIDHNAPTLDDIRHIGGLTFIMARTTHGEIGYSLPGVVANPPAEDLEILARFAKVFDLAHKRFEDLRNSEIQLREAKIVAALERIRAEMMAMHKSTELRDVISSIFIQLQDLGFNVPACSIVIYQDDLSAKHWFAGFTDGAYPESYTIPYVDVPYYTDLLKAWQQGAKFEEFVMEGDAKVAYAKWLLENSDFKHLPSEFVEQSGMSTPEPLFFGDAYMRYGMVETIGDHPLEEEKVTILKRIAKVFEQTYTRFLDLQKAEAQAREAEIELSLERVRARAMAMHESDELAEVIEIIFKELKSQGFDLLECSISTYMDNSRDLIYWSSGTYGSALPTSVKLQYIDHPVLVGLFSDFESGITYRSGEYSGELLKTWWERVFTETDFKHAPKEFIESWKKITRIFYAQAAMNHGFIEFVGQTPLSEDKVEILKRFTTVVDLAYTRYHDVMKAEAQAKEAKIEMALEKIRSRTMAMQTSLELPEAANLLFLEIQSLGIPAWSCGYNILSEDQMSSTCWMSSEGHIQEGFTLPLYGEISFDEMGSFIRSEDDFLEQVLDEKAVQSHYGYMTSLPELQSVFKDIGDAGLSLPSYQINHLCKFKQGFLLFITYEQVPDAHDIFKRFTSVFEQTYTRFLDLQKAEAQRREAQIEAALERVRASTMAIQKQDDLLDVITLLADQLVKLGINLDSANFSNGLSEKDWDIWIFNRYFEAGMQTSRVYYPWIDHPMFQEIEALLENFKKGIDLNVAVFSQAELRSFVDYVFTNTIYKDAEDAVGIRESMRNMPGYTWSAICLNDTWVSMNRFNTEPFTDEENDILRRFANAFGHAYTRFLDVQKAEEQAREAQIEAGLERVRSRTMGMQKSDELGDVATILFKELNQLVDNLWTCGFVLCEEDRPEDEWWLSAENGFIPSFYLPNIGDRVHENMYTAWKQGKVYHTEQIEGEELEVHYNWLMALPAAKTVFDDLIASGFELPTWQKLHCAYFKTGYLVMITQVPCEEEEIFKKFAHVFDLTYTRFLDLQLKEEQAIEIVEEKKRLEITLNDLRSTQKQLIHSEKMASLGELTAGIAHEIQNPLNFVNNFSEVSHELMDEMNSEIEKGDMEEAKAIGNDIKQNLEKITQHGKRADAIVKGMLQHSRSSTSVKEPTDINKLVDEYVRLAYHGLRAKDKSFNVKLETQLDPNLNKVDVIPQDIGRVILNVFTNACYAVSEKKSKLSRENEIEEFQPTVSVRTKKLNDHVVIVFRDNGSGIPQSVIDKIFQPFYTTKPTGEGTGLGLSMSYDVIHAHNGDIEVQSEPGRYTEFSILLP
jgi:signal transduction histidine kinase/ketosteroid isomerase-like protein